MSSNGQGLQMLGGCESWHRFPAPAKDAKSWDSGLESCGMDRGSEEQCLARVRWGTAHFGSPGFGHALGWAWQPQNVERSSTRIPQDEV